MRCDPWYSAKSLSLCTVLAILAACVTTYTYDVIPTVGDLGFAKKQPLSAALFIAPKDQQRIFSKKGRADYTASFAVGAGLVRAAPEVYGQVFRAMTTVDSMAAGEAHDLIVRPQVADLDFRWGWPGVHAVRIHLAVSVFANGKPIGEQTYVSKEHSVDVQDLIRDVNRVTSQALVESLAASARDFATGSDLARRVATLVAEKRQIEKSLLVGLESVNRYLRVVASEAVVRAAPAKDQMDLDTFPLGSVVHAIGYLPSGWYRIAKDGKPFGWLQESTVRPDEPGDRDRTAMIGTKPTIFLAYPKGGEELAEDKINLVGYVVSSNQTKDFTVSVNRFPLNVSSLWTGTALDTSGLRGYPVELTLPLQPGENKIELQIKDADGFVERKTVIVKRIEIAEDTRTASVTDLPPRLPNIDLERRDQAVTTDNFMAVLGEWVKDTAKSDFNKGNSMFDQGRFVRGAYYFRKSIKTEPMGQAWFNLGISEKALGHQRKAYEAFSEACRMGTSQACNISS